MAKFLLLLKALEGVAKQGVLGCMGVPDASSLIPGRIFRAFSRGRGDLHV